MAHPSRRLLGVAAITFGIVATGCPSGGADDVTAETLAPVPTSARSGATTSETSTVDGWTIELTDAEITRNSDLDVIVLVELDVTAPPEGGNIEIGANCDAEPPVQLEDIEGHPRFDRDQLLPRGFESGESASIGGGVHVPVDTDLCTPEIYLRASRYGTPSDERIPVPIDLVDMLDEAPDWPSDNFDLAAACQIATDATIAASNLPGTGDLEPRLGTRCDIANGGGSVAWVEVWGDPGMVAEIREAMSEGEQTDLGLVGPAWQRGATHHGMGFASILVDLDDHIVWLTASDPLDAADVVRQIADAIAAR